MVPQARQRYCSVIAWVPNSERTSASVAWQWGQRGDRRGSSWSSSSSGTGGGELALFQAAEHRVRALVDGAGLAAPPNRVPARPVDLDGRGRLLHPLLEAGEQL